ncbi:DUF4175 domain-containing protein [Phytoactinopolyspora halotolerans]|uniref:DUF4175 domain-containing protein n=1 Tax=Phytoactinopolyspora halotolerans TaxID=1981512 RepID=UPI001C20351D|nr:DUF4175 domain-containing protein [Phytoactinopolyspora halotolerans]
MFRRLLNTSLAERRGSLRGLAIAVTGALLAALWLVPPSVSASEADAPEIAQEQVLVWTASDSTTEYTSAPATATAGPATIVFENSAETGNTTGMPHTLTFDRSNPDYNQDVNLDILANPFDSNGGRHEAQVVLTAGQYRYFCDIPGHGQMSGVLVVTDDGGGEDTTPPSVSVEVTGDRDDDGNYVGSATVSISATDADSGVDTIEFEIDDTGFQEYTGPVDIDQPGDHSVQYRATDNAGNTSDTGTVSFTVVEADPGDTTPPQVSAEVSGDQNDDGDYVGSATVSVTATDADSGVDTVEYEINGSGYQTYTGPVTVEEPGDYMIHYRATDNAGNTSDIGMLMFTVVEPDPGDTTPPQVSAEVSGDQNDDGDYVGSATVTVTATDADSGVDTVEYDLDGAGWQPYTEPVTVDEAGEHVLEYRATDNAGNTSDVHTVIFTVVEPDPGDTTPPQVAAEVAGDQNGDGDYVGSATVTVTATDADSGVDTVEYDLDGAGWQPYTGPVTVTEPGEHTLRYRATDNAGNTSEIDSVAFTVVAPDPDDTTPPQVAAEVAGDQNGDGDYVGSATVSISATDADSGVDTVEYDLDGAGWQPYTGPVTVADAGEHMLHFRATDNAGNTSEAGMVHFTVVESDSDACPGSDNRDTVIIGTIDTTVPNVEVEDGCTISDLIDQDGDYANHGQFVRHVGQVTRARTADGVISAREKSRIMRAAAQSGIGR